MVADPEASAVGVVAAGVETEGIPMQRPSLTTRMTSRRSSSRRHEKDQLDKSGSFNSLGLAALLISQLNMD